jgi:rubrerythrin
MTSIGGYVGVSVNYHGLADFRTAHPELLDRLLAKNVASLSVAEVIDLDEVAQDGVRVRASAGTKSFRRRKKLYKELKKARRLVDQLQREATDDPHASNRRIVAAKERAAREREARVKAALEKMAEIEAQRARRLRTNKKQVEKQTEPRVSTTDPDARVMKMADGGFRPAYNCQIASVADGEIVIDTEVKTVGSDRGLARPMLDDIKRRYGRWPKRCLVDGGFNKNDDTEWAASQGIKIYGPPTSNKHDRDPYAPCARDKPGVAAWRARMKSPHGKSVYESRTSGMHQRSLPKLGSLPVRRPRCRKDRNGPPLVRTDQQYPGRAPPAPGQGITAILNPPSSKRADSPSSSQSSNTITGSQDEGRRHLGS